MNVELINYTADALDLLLFTKQTRLAMSAAGFDEIKAWPMEKKIAELDYMRDTIQSSWEFVDYTFAIRGVSRAFTHQLVRHRVGTSFAQQSQRTVDMSGFEYVTPPALRDTYESKGSIYARAMGQIEADYSDLLDANADPQDARGILPTNIATNIVFKANLRTLHEMGLKRLCVRTQGEFQDVFRAMKDAVVAVHPWTERFIRVWCGFYGTCCFPRHPVDKCPVKPIVYNPQTQRAYGHAEYGLASPDDINGQFEANRAYPQT